MAQKIMLETRMWKNKSTTGDLVKHCVGVDIIDGILVGYHLTRVLTDNPDGYHDGYQIIRKFGDKYLIASNESYTCDTWCKIVTCIEKLIAKGAVGNLLKS